MLWRILVAAALCVLWTGVVVADGTAGGKAGPDRDTRMILDRLARHKDELRGWFEGNATLQGNFSVQRDSVPSLERAVRRVQAPSAEPHAYLRNISGYFLGNWTAENVANMSAFKTPKNAEAHNVTEERGRYDWFFPKQRMLLRLKKYGLESTNNVSLLLGNLAVQGRTRSNASTEQEFDLVGELVHASGHMYLTGVMQAVLRNADIRDLFSMLPPDDKPLRNATYALAQERLDTVMDLVRRGSFSRVPPEDEQAAQARVLQRCALHLYAQLEPSGPPERAPALDALERELADPTGLAAFHAPQIALRAAAYSPNCALQFDAGRMPGLLEVQHWAEGRYYAVCMMLLQLLQLLLVTSLYERTQTPSALSRLSAESVFLLFVFDAHVALLHLVLGMALTNSLRTPMIAVGFLGCVLFLVYEYRIFANVLRARIQMAAAEPAPPPGPPPAQAASGGAQAPDGDETPEDASWMAALRARFSDISAGAPRVMLMIFLLGVFVVTLVAPWLVALCLVPALFSFWVPQIVHNVRKRTVGATTPAFVIGTTLAHVFFPLYLFQYPRNLFFFEPTSLVWFLVAWLALQMLVLLAQQAFGPRFFVPSCLAPHEPAWDWHPSPTKLAAMLQQAAPGDLERAPDSIDPEHLPLGDCPICLVPNDWAAQRVPSAAEHHAEGPEREHLLEEHADESEYSDYELPSASTQEPLRCRPRAYGWWHALGAALRRLLRGRDAPRPNVMVTPCHHIFHTDCLTHWMEIKNECPSCRWPLPPSA